MNLRDLYENVMFLTRNISNFMARPNYPDYLSHAWLPTEGTALYERARQDRLLSGRGDVKYKDPRVVKAKQFYDRCFLEKYDTQYYQFHDELMKMFDNALLEDLLKNNKFMLIGTLPLAALYASYACALNGVPAQRHLDRLVVRFFEAIDSENSVVSYSDLCNSVLEGIEE